MTTDAPNAGTPTPRTDAMEAKTLLEKWPQRALDALFLCRQLERELTALRTAHAARLDRVEAALVKYGRHFPLCNIITRLGVGEPKCGCDFDATMRAIAAAGGQTESTAVRLGEKSVEDILDEAATACKTGIREFDDAHTATKERLNSAAAPSTATAPNVAGYCELDGIGAWKAPSTDNAQREEAYPTDPVLQEKWKRDEALRIEGMEIAEKICDDNGLVYGIAMARIIRAEIARRQGKEAK